MEKINFAFAGFRHNHIYGVYERIINDSRFSFSGAYEADEASRTEAIKRGVTFKYSSLDELLNDSGVDVVAIGDCYSARGEIALKALKSGKNVLADKPLCTDIKELYEIRNIAAEKNLSVGIMLDLRSNRNVCIAKEIIDSGRVGKINNIIFQGQHPLNYGSRQAWYFEKGKHGGTINDIGIHGVDLVRRFTGEEITEIIGARSWNFYADMVPYFKDSAQFMLSTESGTGVIADVSYAAPSSFGYTHPSYWHFVIWGKNGMLDFSNNTSGVACYFENESDPVIISDCNSEYDWFEDYIESLLLSEYRMAYTSDVLESQENALLIQQKS